ncbi:MAG: ROK family protein [Verrucomicrobiales bacterium]
MGCRARLGRSRLHHSRHRHRRRRDQRRYRPRRAPPGDVLHLQLPREPDDGFAGACPFHGGCLEGLASGPAIEQRWGNPGAELPTEHPAWDLQARYLASAAMNIALTLSPRKILLGGGVMAAPGLIERTRAHFADRLKAYLQAPAILAPNFLCAPGLGDKAGFSAGSRWLWMLRATNLTERRESGR